MAFQIEEQEGQNVIINERGALAIHLKSWLPRKEADLLLHTLIEELQWEQPKGTYKGNEFTVPRFMYFCGPEGKIHSYGGMDHVLHAWHPEVLKLKERIEAESGCQYNAALLNYYPTGQHYIAFHSDRETNGDYNRNVSMVSLGGPRDFQFKCKFEERPTITVKIESGDYLAMVGRCQDDYTHGCPKRAYAEPRISITLRKLQFTRE